MKWIFSNLRSYNLATIESIYVSCNYLMLTTGGGLNAREIQFVYGTDEELKKLHKAVMDFIQGPAAGFDCDAYLKTIR
jgi:hypothetical protein